MHIVGYSNEVFWQNSIVYHWLQIIAGYKPEISITLFANFVNTPHHNLVTIQPAPKPKSSLLKSTPSFNNKFWEIVMPQKIDYFLWETNQFITTKVPDTKNFYCVKNTSPLKKQPEGLQILSSESFFSTNKNSSTIYHNIQEYSSALLNYVPVSYVESASYYFADVTDCTLLQKVNLLKAFSQVKKWYKSSIQIVLYDAVPIDDDFNEKLKGYLYKDDVQLISGDESEEAILRYITNAKALINIQHYSWNSYVFAALCNQISVVCVENDVWQSVLQESAWYFKPNEELSLGRVLIYTYKNDEDVNEKINLYPTITTHYTAENVFKNLNATLQLN